MQVKELIEKMVPEIIDGLGKCERCPIGTATEKGLNLAGQQAVQEVLSDLISVLFPGCHGQELVPGKDLSKYLLEKLASAAATLREQIKRAFEYQFVMDNSGSHRDSEEKAEDAISYLIKSLPEIQKVLQRDILAGYEGDPAAKSTMEVVMSYPGFYAIAVHRIAHLLYEKKVPLIPRIMSEYAHSRTGIDIHPGAKIDAGFFTDHGTGVVIGETCVIGENVKLYQGVTLGALSFPKDEHGKLVKGIKRHPNVRDNVVIYSGATILGDITIGENSVIGGNVWLIHSVPANSKVYNQQPKPLIKQAQGSEAETSAEEDR